MLGSDLVIVGLKGKCAGALGAQGSSLLLSSVVCLSKAGGGYWQLSVGSVDCRGSAQLGKQTLVQPGMCAPGK